MGWRKHLKWYWQGRETCNPSIWRNCPQELYFAVTLVWLLPVTLGTGISPSHTVYLLWQTTVEHQCSLGWCANACLWWSVALWQTSLPLNLCMFIRMNKLRMFSCPPGAAYSGSNEHITSGVWFLFSLLQWTFLSLLLVEHQFQSSVSISLETAFYCWMRSGDNGIKGAPPRELCEGAWVSRTPAQAPDSYICKCPVPTQVS